MLLCRCCCRRMLIVEYRTHSMCKCPHTIPSTHNRYNVGITGRRPLLSTAPSFVFFAASLLPPRHMRPPTMPRMPAFAYFISFILATSSRASYHASPAMMPSFFTATTPEYADAHCRPPPASLTPSHPANQPKHMSPHPPLFIAHVRYAAVQQQPINPTTTINNMLQTRACRLAIDAIALFRHLPFCYTRHHLFLQALFSMLSPFTRRDAAFLPATAITIYARCRVFFFIIIFVTVAFADGCCQPCRRFYAMICLPCRSALLMMLLFTRWRFRLFTLDAR